MNLKKRSLTPILTVCLFAVYPVIVLYAHNVEEVVLSQARLPLILSLIFMNGSQSSINSKENIFLKY